MMTIKDVQSCFDATLRKKATPHRTPDFKQLFKEFGKDAPVRGFMWFIEEHNTGYPGTLERWEFRDAQEDGQRFSFWADLLPGLITVVDPVLAVKAAVVAHTLNPSAKPTVIKVPGGTIEIG